VTTDRPDVSFVVSTLGPAELMHPLLDSLAGVADHVALELIVCDQSVDQQVEAVLAKDDRPFAWRVTRSARGLSRGRNAALPLARGQIVAFPDDDLRYPPGVVEHVVGRLQREPELDGLAIALSESDDGPPSVLRFPDREVEVTPGNILLTVISCGLFLRRRVTTLIGPFDEQLGAGSGTRWGAGEETDYVLRGLSMGASLRFDPTVCTVHHDKALPAAEARAKARRYGEGIGLALRRHGVAATRIAHLAARRGAKVALLAARGRFDDSRTAGAWGVGLVAGYLRPGPDPSPAPQTS
jgi:hypothetical protein